MIEAWTGRVHSRFRKGWKHMRRTNETEKLKTPAQNEKEKASE